MQPFDPRVSLTVTRIRVEFADDIGNRLGPILGTAFVVSTAEGRLAVVTNRHNLDPRLKNGPETRLRASRIELELRVMLGEQPSPETQFFRVTNADRALFTSPDADCAIVFDPEWEDRPPHFNLVSLIREGNIATASDLREKVHAMDVASFIGFPGHRGAHWWDETWKLPILRSATIASWPAVPFTNSNIKTTDALLVTGFSFTGSSGSPLILHRKGIPPGGDIHDPGYVPPMLIGIMSGHFWETPQDAPEMFRHSGLSYATRSTSILALIEGARRHQFKAPEPADCLLRIEQQ